MIKKLVSAGAKIRIAVAVVLAAISISYVTIQYIQKVERDRIEQEQKIESLQAELDLRKETNEILNEVRKANPNRDGAIALERLRSRYREGQN